MPQHAGQHLPPIGADCRLHPHRFIQAPDLTVGADPFITTAASPIAPTNLAGTAFEALERVKGIEPSS